MTLGRKAPPECIQKHPSSIHPCQDSECRHTVSGLYEIPPDPKTSFPTKKLANNADQIERCLFDDIDPNKLSSLLCAHPVGRCTALLLQAIRQQVTVAASVEYSRKALEWIINNDVLLLKMKRNSVLVHVLQADGVDSREQMSRMINAIASYAKGRQYLLGHLRVFVTCVVAVLRGRRLPTSTQEQLIATLQKTSVKPSCQRELLQCGMLEWVVNLLEGRTTPYATEYACSLAINLSLNSHSHSLQLRFADSLAAAACNVLNRDTHGLACYLLNSLVLVWLGCSRVRLRAKDTRLLDALRTRSMKKNCPLCELHIPYLLAVIAGEAEIVKVPQIPNDADTDNAGDSCEREIDATDPLRLSTNELSGAKLLLRRALFKEISMEVQPTVPGQVIWDHKFLRTSHGSMQGYSNETRLSTATSEHTFVIETERRKPLVLPVGLTDGAIKYKKCQEASRKAKEAEEKRLQQEQAEREAAEAKERERQSQRRPRSSARKPSTVRKGITNLSESRDFNKARRTPIQKKPTFESSDVVPCVSAIPTSIDDCPRASHVEFEDENELDYMAVFGARPKLARTPDGVINRGGFSQENS